MTIHVLQVPDDERADIARLAEALSKPWTGLSLAAGGGETVVSVPPALAALITEAIRELADHGVLVVQTETADPDALAPDAFAPAPGAKA